MLKVNLKDWNMNVFRDVHNMVRVSITILQIIQDKINDTGSNNTKKILWLLLMH